MHVLPGVKSINQTGVARVLSVEPIHPSIFMEDVMLVAAITGRVSVKLGVLFFDLDADRGRPRHYFAGNVAGFSGLLIGTKVLRNGDGAKAGFSLLDGADGVIETHDLPHVVVVCSNGSPAREAAIWTIRTA